MRRFNLTRFGPDSREVDLRHIPDGDLLPSFLTWHTLLPGCRLRDRPKLQRCIRTADRLPVRQGTTGRARTGEGVCHVSLEIIGAGFGRTGTVSMKAAVEILGFGPCYHMREILMARPG